MTEKILGIAAIVLFVGFTWQIAININQRAKLDILSACHTWALEGYVIANPPDCLTFTPGSLHRSLAPKQNPGK